MWTTIPVLLKADARYRRGIVPTAPTTLNRLEGGSRVVRVLWLSTETPARDGQGGQRRQYHQIRALQDRGHDITVLVPKSDQGDASIRSIAPVLRPRVTLFRRRDRGPVR